MEDVVAKDRASTAGQQAKDSQATFELCKVLRVVPVSDAHTRRVRGAAGCSGVELNLSILLVRTMLRVGRNVRNAINHDVTYSKWEIFA
jgi:hypothetical protein